MDYFEEAEKDLTEKAEQSSQPDENDPLRLPEGMVRVEDAGDDFWKGIKKSKEPKKKGRALGILLKVGLAVMLVCSGIGISMISLRGNGWLSNLISGGKNMNFTLPVSERPKLDSQYMQEDGRYTTEGVAKAAANSVVYIETYSQDKAVLSKGQGSGVIMTDTGYIVTNAHVIAGAQKGMKVVTNDGIEYAAKLVGADETTDIAVIKIPAQGLTPAEFGDSDSVVQGEQVVTIGSPAGYNNSVTVGVVSSVNRKVRSKDGTDYINCIQKDAPINPGNSGGGLFNMCGQVIGITSSKLSSNDYEGIGFAITTEQLKPVIEDIIEKGYVTGRVKMGITYYAVSETTADINDMLKGLYVVGISEDCDIANTELQEGDIITAIDGKDPLSFENVSDIYKDKKAGDTVTCEVCRENTEGEYDVFEISFKLMEDNGGLIES